jgi:hypothetical protein
MVDMWKWQFPRFSRGCWKSFPSETLEMSELQGNRHFQISTAIFTAMRSRPTGDITKNVATFNRAPAVISHPVKPAPSLRIARRADHPEKVLARASPSIPVGRACPLRGSPRFTTLSISGAASPASATTAPRPRIAPRVDQHNRLGLGNDVPISTGNENDALLALVDGKWVVLRVPYPLSFYAKGLDGRIDDPNAGWKGRGVWTTSGDRAPWLKEGGKGTVPIAFYFQLRPNPLAD